jgi:hypothetical protein
VHLSARSVVRVLLTATSRTGDRFAVVLCTDDTFCITRNDTLIPELSWAAEAADECIDQLLEFSGVGRS